MRRTRAQVLARTLARRISAALICVALSAAGHAATITVNTTADELDVIPNDRCSLREAVVTVNEQRALGVGGCSVSGTIGVNDVIVVPAGLYRLTRNDVVPTIQTDQDFDNLNVRRDVTIRGAGAGVTVIDGEAIAYQFPLVGWLPIPKGGVINVAAGVTATIEGLTIRRGEAFEGGGVYVAGDLTLRDAAVEHNTAVKLGAGIHSVGALILERVTIAENGPPEDLDPDDWPLIGGGVFSKGTLRAENTTVSANVAHATGGIHLAADADLTILHSVTITDNQALGSLNLADPRYAGGLNNWAQGDTVRVQNSLIAGNSAPGESQDCRGEFDSRGYNLIGMLGECGGFSINDLRGSFEAPIDPVLAPLGNYGGNTRTHALLPGSPAVDAGPLPATGDCLDTDQRGFPRGMDGDLNGFVHCDIGAFEGAEGMAGEANLEVSLAGSPGPVGAGGTISYSVQVRNNGPARATGVTYALTLPPGAGAVTSLPAGCSAAGGIVSCSVGNMDELSVLEEQVDVTAPATTGAVITSVTVASTSTDPEPGDDYAEVVTRIVPATSADLWLSMTADASVVRGSEIEFVLTAGNLGPQAADSLARVTNFLPQNATLLTVPAGCSRFNDMLTCPVAGLTPGATQEFRVVVTAPDQLGYVTNSASILAEPGADLDLSNNSATFSTRLVNPPPPVADLAITKVGPSTAQVGGQLTYHLITTNNGPESASDVQVVDELPAGTSPVSLPTICEAVGQTVTCAVGALAPGATGTLALVVTAPATEGEIENVASVVDLGGSLDPNPLQDEASVLTTITAGPPPAGADLALSKSGPATARPGAEISYSLIITNHGPDAAGGVTVTDTLPAGTAVTSVAAPCEASATTVVCEMADLAAGASAEFLLKVTAPTSEGEITNTATVTSTTADAVPTNNTDSVTTIVTADAPVGPPQLSVVPHPSMATSGTARPYEEGMAALRFRAATDSEESVTLVGLTLRVTGQSGGHERVSQVTVYAETSTGLVLLASGEPGKVPGGGQFNIAVLDVAPSQAGTITPGEVAGFTVLVDVSSAVAGHAATPLAALLAAALLPLGWARRRKAKLALLALAVLLGSLTACQTASPEGARPNFQVVLDTVTAVGADSGAFAEVDGVPVTGTKITLLGGS